RQRTAAEDQREIRDLLLRELAADDAFVLDPLFDARCGNDFVVEDDRELTALVVAGQFRELLSAFGRKREADDRLAELALLRTRGLQIRACDRNGLANR